MAKKDFKFNLVTIDIYKTERARNPSKKMYLYDVKTINEVIDKVKKKYDNVYTFSIYDGDINFVGKFINNKFHFNY